MLEKLRLRDRVGDCCDEAVAVSPVDVLLTEAVALAVPTDVVTVAVLVGGGVGDPEYVTVTVSSSA